MNNQEPTKDLATETNQEGSGLFFTILLKL